MEKSTEVPQKIKTRPTIWLSNLIFRYLSKENKNNELTPTRTAKTENTDNTRCWWWLWSNRNSHSLLVGMQNGTATLENSLVFSYKTKHDLTINSVQLLSCVRLFATPWAAALQASLSIINSRSLLKLTSIKSVMPSNHLILCHPLLFLSSIFPNIRVFSYDLTMCAC